MMSNTMLKKLAMYALFGDYGRYSEKLSRSRHFNVYFSKFFFDNYFSISSMYQNKLKIDKSIVRRLIHEITDARYDVVYCGDSCEALLLQYVLKKYNAPPKYFLINEVDLFKRAKQIDNLISLYYHEHFFNDFITSSRNHWFCTEHARIQDYNNLGIKKANLHYIPLSLPNIKLFFEEMGKRMENSKRLKNDSEFAGKILSSGSHDRDYALLVKAIEGLDVKANIICNLEMHKPVHSMNVVWHHSFPEEGYIKAIRSAKYIVLPLTPTERVAGQLNCIIAMYFGKIIIAPECQSLAECLKDNETGILYRQGDVESLRGKIVFVEKHFSNLQSISERARERASELSKIASRNIKALAKSLNFLSNN